MEPTAESDRLRQLSSHERTADMELRIDAGFVNHRKIFPLIGTTGVAAIERQIEKLPDLPDGLRSARIDGLYSDFLLGFCRELGVPTLGMLLGKGKGQIFCSTEEVEATPEIYEFARVSTRIPARRVTPAPRAA